MFQWCAFSIMFDDQTEKIKGLSESIAHLWSNNKTLFVGRMSSEERRRISISDHIGLGQGGNAKIFAPTICASRSKLVISQNGWSYSEMQGGTAEQVYHVRK